VSPNDAIPMNGTFALLDWCVVAGYFAAIALVGILASRRVSSDARDYFLAGGRVPAWLAAISVLATTQSAATFLGGPDYGYRGDFTYLSVSLGALLAAFIVARLLMPRFYTGGVSTVYELLGRRYGSGAMQAAGLMFVVGRILAGGARLYLAAVAVSMIVFNGVSGSGVLSAAAILILASFIFTFHGGLRSIVWVDLLQFSIYAVSALALLALLFSKIPVPLSATLHGLAATPEGHNKLQVIDWSFALDRPFSLPAVLLGGTLLYVGNYGLDQDTTQRLLACKDADTGSRGLYMSALAAIPVMAIFIAIGSLLYVVYQRPDLMGGATLAGPARGSSSANVTTFMHFILTQAPPGLRGLATTGVLATAIGTTMSALNAMSSVLVQDFYRPWKSRHIAVAETHYVLAGRVGMGLTGLATLGVAVLSFYWQRYTNTPLIEFVLSMMTFAYAGLLGVYFAALFTRRGTSPSVTAALFMGFAVIFLLQPYIADHLGMPSVFRRLAFPWQLCLGTLVSFLTCVATRSREPQYRSSPSLLGVLNAH
jgi:SSS family solute:Na+ symporter